MPIQKSPVNINFSLGLDQKTDPFQLKTGRFLSLVNRVFNKGGRLEKRSGYEALGNSVANPALPYTNSKIPSTLASGRNLATYNGELILNDGLNLYSYSETPNNFVYKGRAELCSVTSQSIYRSQNNNIGADCALNSTLGLNVYAWESWTADPRTYGTLNGVQISVVDSVTNQTIFTSNLASTTSRPRCVSISDKLYVLYFDSADSDLHVQPVTQAGFGVASTLISDIDTTLPNYDVIVNNSLIYVAYNGGSSTVKVASFSSTLSAVASASKSEVGSNGVGIFPDTSNNVWIVYNNSTETKAFIMDSALAVTVLAPTVVDSGSGATGVQNVTGVFDGTKGVIFYDKPGLPILGQSAQTTNANYTQPAVGATVNVVRTPTNDAYTIVYIDTGGYYFMQGITDLATQTATMKNLGYAGNAAPAATITAPQPIYPTAGYQNSIITFNTLTAAGSVGTPAVFNRSLCLGGKAFLVNGVAHVIMAHDSAIQPTYFVGALYNTLTPVPNAAIVAKIAQSESGGLPYRSILPAVNVVSTGIFEAALINRTFSIERTSNDVPHQFFYQGVFSAGLNFVTDNIQTNELGNNLQVGSGTILMYDGSTVVEQGFHLFPETVTLELVVGGGLSEGLYGYQVVYEWIDNQGQTHRSAPSPNVSIESVSERSVEVTIPTLRVTEKQGVTIAIYRTQADGSIYYRVDTMSVSYPVNNSVSTNTVTFTDATPDVDISGNEQLYTLQEVENIAPPASNIITEYKNRLIIVPSVNPYVWEFSKQVISGSPVEFSDLFQKNLTTVGGPIIGAFKLDDKIIFFKPQSLYYVTGTGPALNGTNDDFSEAQFITADAGLLDPRSIVNTPVGVMFKSSKGIYLLDRSMQTRYIGSGVADYNSFTVRGAKLLAQQNQVRFILSNGVALVYDYFWTDESGVGQWGTFSNVSAISDVVFDDLHTYVNSSGQVYRESPGTYVDGATPVDTSFKTGWINLAGLQGFERAYFFYFLAKYLSAHTLTVNLYYDYDESTVAQTLTITPDPLELEQWRVFLSKQKCQAFQIEIIEVSAGGAGFTMSGLDLVVGLKKGYVPIKATSSAS